MLSDDKFIDVVCKSADAYYTATGKVPNVVYVSSKIYNRVNLIGYPYIALCSTKSNDKGEIEIVDDWLLFIKKHSNGHEYDEDIVYVCWEYLGEVRRSI